MLAGFVIALAPFGGAASAQEYKAGKVYRIGFLSGDSRETGVAQEIVRLLPELLRRHGYVEGQNLRIEWRWADGKVERLRALADDLVRLNVDLIIAYSNGPIAATKQATRTVPVVMMIGNLPVESGFIESLSRPGGNITGTTFTPPETAAKNVQVIKEAIPRTSRLTVIYDPTFPGMQVYKGHADRAALSLGIVLHYVEIRRPEDFTFAFDTIDKAPPDALMVVPTEVVRTHMREIIRFALERKLPTLGTGRFVVDSGGLLYYGADVRGIWERAATYVDRILRGAKPADLPVEQPTKFELVINLKTAKALGLTIPPSLLLRADQVIE